MKPMKFSVFRSALRILSLLVACTVLTCTAERPQPPKKAPKIVETKANDKGLKVKRLTMAAESKKVTSGSANKAVACAKCSKVCKTACYAAKCPGDCDYTPGRSDDDFLWFCDMQPDDDKPPPNAQKEDKC
eukprot:gnl/TRDRNA2_/TRDRNA2_184052_c0_seq1.p1 gnl/TRDRNA2_/TRDRNA2_184052_c0~~gnl/TRDRNA2_/TRDRNA2_184052_c0_seq1.p1  ORF type:complete len:131 (-),score=24.35 gnl/TRDRNA2_/TRDRNA2_184052_c0_seq1:133-525(-)